MSSTVPTISISYSIKARGINRDLFGDLPVVLDTPSLNLQTLTEKLELLQSEEKRIKEILKKTLPEWRARARRGRSTGLYLLTICQVLLDFRLSFPCSIRKSILNRLWKASRLKH